jgi:hypothetical protein
MRGCRGRNTDHALVFITAAKRPFAVSRSDHRRQRLPPLTHCNKQTAKPLRAFNSAPVFAFHLNDVPPNLFT